MNLYKLLLVLLIIFLFLNCDKNEPTEPINNTITDIDGNVYQTVRIGTQTWMAENLKVTRYRNGESIPKVTDNSIWENLTTSAYCDYDNNANYVATYGRLYNWYVVNDSNNVAPVGWHVPSEDDWMTLLDYLGGIDVAGEKMKETGTEHWVSEETKATNESGLSALPGGWRFENGNFLGIGYGVNFWSSSELNSSRVFAIGLFYTDKKVTLGEGIDKKAGCSIRCVKD